MSKLTPFSLFMRQALLYPLASPFLPPVDKVEVGYNYANNSLVGTLEGVPAELVWQNDQNVSFTWDSAVLYAQYLEADGVTVSDVPQDIWRLPTLIEMIGRFFEEFVLLINSGFPMDTYFWSSTEFDISNVWFIGWWYGMASYVADPKTSVYNVRCVR